MGGMWASDAWCCDWFPSNQVKSIIQIQSCNVEKKKWVIKIRTQPAPLSLSFFSFSVLFLFSFFSSYSLLLTPVRANVVECEWCLGLACGGCLSCLQHVHKRFMCVIVTLHSASGERDERKEREQEESARVRVDFFHSPCLLFCLLSTLFVDCHVTNTRTFPHQCDQPTGLSLRQLKFL